MEDADESQVRHALNTLAASAHKSNFREIVRQADEAKNKLNSQLKAPSARLQMERTVEQFILLEAVRRELPPEEIESIWSNVLDLGFTDGEAECAALLSLAGYYAFKDEAKAIDLLEEVVRISDEVPRLAGYKTEAQRHLAVLSKEK